MRGGWRPHARQAIRQADRAAWRSQPPVRRAPERGRVENSLLRGSNFGERQAHPQSQIHQPSHATRVSRPTHKPLPDPSDRNLAQSLFEFLGSSTIIAPLVAVMEPANSRERDDLCTRGRLRHHGARNRRVFLNRQMTAVVIVVANVISNETPQMLLIEDDDVVEKFAA